ncbi:MAG: hypothetical protein V1858_01805 [Candidatus Gottesmanbacteria bacterium]
MKELKKSLKRIIVNYYQGQFYLLGEIQLPPIYAWCEVPPIFESPDNDREKLTQAMESARLVSKSKEQVNDTDLNPKQFSKEQEKILDHASKIWSICWEEDGEVSIVSWEQFPKSETVTYKGKAWRPIKDSEVVFHSPVSNSDLAQWLIQQTK